MKKTTLTPEQLSNKRKKEFKVEYGIYDFFNKGKNLSIFTTKEAATKELNILQEKFNDKWEIQYRIKKLLTFFNPITNRTYKVKSFSIKALGGGFDNKSFFVTLSKETPITQEIYDFINTELNIDTRI